MPRWPVAKTKTRDWEHYVKERIMIGKSDRNPPDLNSEPTGEAPPGYDVAPVSAGQLDDRIAQMRSLLEKMRPTSGSEALQMLRRAFPETSLQERVRAALRKDNG